MSRLPIAITGVFLCLFLRIAGGFSEESSPPFTPPAPVGCDFNMERNKTLDTSASKAQGANVSTVGLATALSNKMCANLCCANFSNSCTIAVYNELVKEKNCVLIFCSPVEKCVLTTSSIASSYVLQSRILNTSYDAILKQKPPIDKQQKEISATNISTEKLGENDMATSYTYNPPDLDADKTKNAKARKGVGGGSETTPMTNLLSNKTNGSIGDSTEPMTSNVGIYSTESFLQAETDSGHPTQPENASVVLLDATTTTTTPITTTIESLYGNEKIYTLPTSRRRRPPPTLDSTPLPVSYNITDNSSSVVSATNDSTAATPTMKFAESLPRNIMNMTHKSEGPSNGGFNSGQSVYLITTLVVGVLILLIVVAVTFRHMHEAWERRHYQRMDYLIEGLYNEHA